MAISTALPGRITAPMAGRAEGALGDLHSFVPSWVLHLRREQAARTIQSYTETLEQFVAFLESRTCLPTSGSWSMDTSKPGSVCSAGSARRPRRCGSVHCSSLSLGLNRKAELQRSPMYGCAAEGAEQRMPIIGDDALRALFATCRPPASPTIGTAIMRVMLDISARLAEVTGLRYDAQDAEACDVDLAGGVSVFGVRWLGGSGVNRR
jgi:hypothetical protein